MSDQNHGGQQQPGGWTPVGQPAQSGDPVQPASYAAAGSSQYPPPPPPGSYGADPAYPPPPPGQPPYNQPAYQQNSAAPTQFGGLDDNMAGGLAYFTIFPAIYFLVAAPYNQRPFVKFHSLQCLGLAALGFCLTVIGAIPFLGHLVAVFGWLAIALATIICIYKAMRFEAFKLPIIGDFASRQSGYVVVSGSNPVMSPAVPAGFASTFANRNIAFDQNTGMFWLVDESGFAGQLHKSEITSYQAMTDNSNHQTTLGPRTVRLNNRLLIRTTNLSKPVWTVKFNAHPERTQSGSDQNFAELSEWDARMAAILR